MAPLTTAQKAMVKQYTSVTSGDKKQAEAALRAANWNLSTAVDQFFTANAAPSKALESALNKTFDAYRDDARNNPDTIQMSGTMAYFKDLGVNIEDTSLLVASEFLGCPSLGDTPRAGFVAAWAPLSASTLAAQRSQMALLAQHFASEDARAPGGPFRRVYKHTFRLALPPGSKGLPLDVATEFWRQLFGPKGVPWASADGRTPWLDLYLAFLEERWRKAVNRDLWDQTLLFALQTLEDSSLGWWSEDSAWPGVIDEFVASVKEQRASAGEGAGGEAMEVE